MDGTRYEALPLNGATVEEFDMEEFSDKATLIDGTEKPRRTENAPLRTQQSIRHETICGFDGLRVIIVSAIVVSLAITAAMVITILVGEPQVPPHGAIATDNKVCSDVGMDILQRGGSAVDAAIAAVLCIGVVNGQSSGLGGGGFMLILDAKAAAYTGIDFRETAPANAKLDMFVDNPDASLHSGLAVGIPGELHGLRQAWEKYGKLTWKELFQPAIRFARRGFEVTASLERELGTIPLASMSGNLRALYAPTGMRVKEGDMVYRESYADLLERIADDGIQEFYSGDVAQEIVNTVNKNGGNMTLADLKGYKTVAMAPIRSSYRDYNLVTLPQPSGGPMFLTMMNIMQLFNVTPADRDTSLYYHHFIEAMKFVKAEEIGLGESAVANYSQTMISQHNANLLFANITDDMTHPPDYYFSYAQGVLTTKGTSQISVIDTNNNMVSVTTSVNTAFGSLLMTPSGVILNNVMNDFDWPGKNPKSNSSESNYIAPGRRPQSHMAPIVGRNSTTACARRFATGGEGGVHITAALAYVVMELLGFQSSLANATVPLKRAYPSLIPDKVVLEKEVPDEVITDLKAKGHNVEIWKEKGFAMVQSVMKEKDIMYAVSDPRREGGGASQY
ncbi:gamma-glutamyltranspeptidase 2-like isoform X2 [Acanthaster planci]|uniref:Gamma-glutamyltranspeptidase 2-like isoform X2 n=1 Tax=Acanthaster planci TaxID=133434 RepID=A0A8B7YD29_ACAPL|nr:gamma-glutamyltranspeptidase 2-like isoform X2 [Acanthaster planci]